MSFLPSGLAVKRGFFREEGLEAEVIRMNGNVAITALANGDTDYTMIFGSVVRAAIRGLPMKVVASLIDGSTHALITRSDFKTAWDLKGENARHSSVWRYRPRRGDDDVQALWRRRGKRN